MLSDIEIINKAIRVIEDACKSIEQMISDLEKLKRSIKNETVSVSESHPVHRCAASDLSQIYLDSYFSRVDEGELIYVPIPTDDQESDEDD